MKGNEYADLIARYVLHNFGDRGVEVYREVSIGKSIIGKNRRVDCFAVAKAIGKAYALECKFQATKGTADEKIPYTLRDMAALPLAGAVVYAGEGFSRGVLHMLESSEIAAYCHPPDDLARRQETRELDHLLAMRFGWWDVLLHTGRRVHLTPEDD